MSTTREARTWSVTITRPDGPDYPPSELLVVRVSRAGTEFTFTSRLEVVLNTLGDSLAAFVDGADSVLE